MVTERRGWIAIASGSFEFFRAKVHEFVELRAQNDARENRVEIDPQLPTHCRGDSCRDCGRFFHTPQVRHDLLVKAPALFREGNGASRPIEEPCFQPLFESSDGPANAGRRHAHQFGSGRERPRIDDGGKYADTAREILAGRSHGRCTPVIGCLCTVRQEPHYDALVTTSHFTSVIRVI